MNTLTLLGVLSVALLIVISCPCSRRKGAKNESV